LGVGLVNQPAAEARCIGSTGYLWITGYGQEDIRGTTCDGLKEYYGKTVDDEIDGYCYYVQYDGANGYPGFKNCPDHTWLPYSFTDTNTSSSARGCQYDPVAYNGSHLKTVWDG
jgi:hypothetical protein